MQSEALRVPNMIAEMSGGEIFTTYLRGSALIIQKIDANLYYYLHNGHGDVVQRVGEDENAAPMYEYDAFGNQKEEIETDPNPFRYCGEYWDRDLEEYYFRARTYDPKTGRFGQEDSIDYVGAQLPNGNSILDPLSLNRYAYCEGDPIRYRDTRGRFVLSLLLIGAVTGIIMGGLAGGISAALSGEDVLWGMIGGALVGGIMGAVTAVAGPILSMVAGGLTNAGNSVVQQYVNTGAIDIGEVIIDGLYGIASGYTGWGLGRATDILSLGDANRRLVKALMTGMGWLVEEPLKYGLAYTTKYFYRQAAQDRFIMTPEDIMAFVRGGGNGSSGSSVGGTSGGSRRTSRSGTSAPNTPAQQAAEEFFRSQIPRPRAPSRFTPYSPEGYQRAYEKYLKDMQDWRRRTGRGGGRAA